MNAKLAKYTAITVGCIIGYTVMQQLTDGKFKLILIIALLGYGIYKTSR